VLRDNKRFSTNSADWEFASTMGTAALIPEKDVKLVKPPAFGPHPVLRKLETLEVRLLARS
jgi:hypothetical protein